MKFNIKIFVAIIIALGLGLAAGYLIFGRQQTSKVTTDVHQHDSGAIQVSDEEQIWTCSMHPQIRQNEPGDCPICGMDLIPLEANTSNDPLVLEMTNEAVKLANIQTTTIGEEESSSGKIIRLTGKVQMDERLASSQVAHVPGRIEKLYVTFTGEQVNKGQKLATLYSPELITAQRELLEALKLKTLNPGLVEAARNKLRYWKIGKSSIEAIEQKGTIQETFTLYADESGIVTNRRVAVGDYLKQGEPLFDLMSLQRVWVLFDAYEEDLATITLGDRIEFTTPSIPAKIFKTRITFIDPVINPNTRVASIRTEVKNPNGLLKPEMFVYGSLHENAMNKTQLTVPKSALLWTGTRSVVYVKVPDMSIPSFQFREVEIGEAFGNSYQVLSGLAVGEEIVTNGSFTIDAAAQLNNQASMMNKEVMTKGDDHALHLPDYTDVAPVEFKQQITKAMDIYLQLKDALVATDVSLANSTAQKLTEELENVDMALVKGDAHRYWMEQLIALQAHSQKITELEEIEVQREQFDFLSQAFIRTIKVYGLINDTLYVQHCPMANENNGADWISKEDKIKNPYFGDKMLTCGTVTDTITKNFKNPPMKQASSTRRNLHNH